MKVKLWYLPCNNGDGSVSVRFFTSQAKLSAYQEAEEASPYFEGWGEDCSGSIEVEVAQDGTVTDPNPSRHYKRLDPDPRKSED